MPVQRCAHHPTAGQFGYPEKSSPRGEDLRCFCFHVAHQPRAWSPCRESSEDLIQPFLLLLMVVPSTVQRDWWCPQRCAERCCASLCAAGSLQASRGLTPHTGLPASLSGCCHTATVCGLGGARLRSTNPNTWWCGFGGAVAAFDAPLIGFASRAQTEAASRDHHRSTVMAAATMIARTIQSVPPPIFAGPSRGVGRVHRYDHQTPGGGHRSDGGFESGGGDARELASELFGSFAASEGFTADVSGVGVQRQAPHRTGLSLRAMLTSSAGPPRGGRYWMC